MAMRNYNVLAVPVTIWFNTYGDHDHDGLMYILEEHKPLLIYLEKMRSSKLVEGSEDWNKLMQERDKLINQYGLVGNIARIEEWLPDTKAKAKKPHPVISPLVLRAAAGDTIKVKLKSEIQDRKVGIHLVGPGTTAKDDGTHVGNNINRLLSYGQQTEYTWKCDYEGVFVFHDGGDFRGDENGTNAHGLFGALVVEPTGATWTDPETGGSLSSGLYADVHQRTAAELNQMKANNQLAPFPDINNPASLTKEYAEKKASFREFVIFIHDEPHWVPPHTKLESSPCNPDATQEELAHDHTAGSLMPISYRAEPMISRERELWKRIKAGEIDPNNIVVNEEQHHSSWMFGDPSTPILKAYLGDPVRIRLVHAGVKETHVFHLHVYEWNTVPFRRDSNIIDAVTISPQTGHTIVPFYGAGNKQMVPGDVIWHCHLYPHFHHGMWGMFRTFNTKQDGVDGDYFNSETGAVLTQEEVDAIGDVRTKNKLVRRLGRYPNLTRINKLVPLPDRKEAPAATASKPGYPLFVAGEVAQKSFTPPWHKTKSAAFAEGWLVDDYDYRDPTQIELNAFNTDPRPGELFTTFPHADRENNIYGLPKSKTVEHTIDVLMTPVKYNDSGWWDPHGHLYALADTEHGIKTFSEVVHESFHHAVHHAMEENPGLTEDQAKAKVRTEGINIEPSEQEPLFLRCNKTNVMQLTLHNRLERNIAATPFDTAWPKGTEIGCNAFVNSKQECGLHVHIVKFDPIACDGASTGWNYISAPSLSKKMVYRWWADEEFGVIFTHDHLFANFRQKHGLFGALIVEPETATFHDPKDLNKEIIVGQNAVIRYTDETGSQKAYREFCLGNGDWAPLFKLQEEHAHEEQVVAADAHADHDNFFTANVTFEAHHTTQQVKVHYGMPLEPPNHPDSHDDNGVFGVNYRCEPIHERTVVNEQLVDPAEWFSAKEFTIEGEHGAPSINKKFGDPDTAVFNTLPGEPIRLRLVQGAHEEQHSFQVHGMRWKRFWKDAASPIKNQQTIGLSEAFTFDINEPYGKGDYLWKYSSAEDLWLGCWGIIRAHDPQSSSEEKPLPISDNYVAPEPLVAPPLEQCRRFKVEAKTKTIWYNEDVADPFGLIYNLVAYAPPMGALQPVTTAEDEPLVLRCKQGEWIALELVNKISDKLEMEPMAPELPHGDGERKISARVSLHTDLLSYNVEKYDGSNVGLNPDSTVANNKANPQSYTYFWYADYEAGPVLIQDMADFRNHRHHGLIGAIVIESPATVPYKINKRCNTALINPANEAWYGPRVTIKNMEDGSVKEEMVFIIQDGLRYYLYGNTALPIGDIPGDVGENGPDTEDQGLKGINYKSQPSSHELGYAFTPATPLLSVPKNAKIKLHVIGGCDKPRNHSFTVHGHSWKEWVYLGNESPEMSSEGGITCGSVSTYNITANEKPGDYMYRSGVLKYAVEQGLWGMMRVKPIPIAIWNTNRTEEMAGANEVQEVSDHHQGDGDGREGRQIRNK